MIYGIFTIYILLFTLFSNLHADINDKKNNQSSYYDNTSKYGYWWYEEVLIKDVQNSTTTTLSTKEAQKKDKPEEKALVQRHPSLKDYTFEKLWDMYPDDFQALLESFLKKAVQSASESNVYEYYVLQDIARKKAAVFSQVSSVVWQKNPELTLEKDYPMTAPGREVYITQSNQEVKDKIVSAANEFALLYFYSDPCPYCLPQSNILNLFISKYKGFKIMRINREANSMLVKKFNISGIPSLVLIYKDNRDDFIPVSTGVVSMDTIEERVYRGIRLLKKEITPENIDLRDFQKGGGFDVNFKGYKGLKK